jgi:SAM-dependent methyltransferase
MFDSLIGAWRYRRYLTVQRRQTRAKRAKNASFRLVPFARLVREHCPDLEPSAPVLSIGPRNEVELDALERDGGFTNVTAIDVWSGSPRIRRADMHALPFADASFSLIFASHVFEHAWDFARVASECIRVLRPSGYVFCATPRGFEPDAHDRYCFDKADNLLGYFAPARPEVVYEHVRPTELQLLFRLRGPA